MGTARRWEPRVQGPCGRMWRPTEAEQGDPRRGRPGAGSVSPAWGLPAGGRAGSGLGTDSACALGAGRGGGSAPFTSARTSGECRRPGEKGCGAALGEDRGGTAAGAHSPAGRSGGIPSGPAPSAPAPSRLPPAPPAVTQPRHARSGGHFPKARHPSPTTRVCPSRLCEQPARGAQGPSAPTGLGQSGRQRCSPARCGLRAAGRLAPLKVAPTSWAVVGKEGTSLCRVSPRRQGSPGPGRCSCSSHFPPPRPADTSLGDLKMLTGVTVPREKAFFSGENTGSDFGTVWQTPLVTHSVPPIFQANNSFCSGVGCPVSRTVGPSPILEQVTDRVIPFAGDWLGGGT